MSFMLLIHIGIGLTGVAFVMLGFSENERIGLLVSRGFIPAIVLTVISGILLIVQSGSVARGCVSGGIIIATLLTLRYLQKKSNLRDWEI